MLFISMYSTEVNIALFCSSHYSVLISVMLHTRNVPGQKGFKSSRDVQSIKKRGRYNCIYINWKDIDLVLTVCAKMAF